MPQSNHLKSLLCVCLAIVASTRGEVSQDQKTSLISLGQSVHISADNPKAAHVESFLALNPKKPSQLLASSIVSGETPNAATYVSNDRGRSWRRSQTSPGVSQPTGGDPVVYYDLNGTALFGGLCDSPDCAMRIWRSADGGGRWDSSATVPGNGYDREYLAIDRTPGPFSGRVYVAGTNGVRQSNGGSYPVLGITSSTDGGRTFSPLGIVDVTADGKSHAFGGIGDMLITSRGTLVVPILSSQNLTPSPIAQFWSMTSDDGGRSFSGPKPGLLLNCPRAGFRALVACGNIRAAIDESNGPFKDRVYVTWVALEDDRYVVKVTYSDDLGSNWSRAVTVNDAKGPTDSSNAAIAVNKNGILSVVWNDRRGDPKGECYRLYVSASLDGGDTFLPNVEVNPRPTCPNTRGNWSRPLAYSQGPTRIAMSGVPARFPNGGETQGLVVDPDGRFHVAWINGESGVMQLWYTNFRVTGVARPTLVAQVGSRPSPKTNTVDVARGIALDVSSPLLDFDAKFLGFAVRLVNNTSLPIQGPLTIVLDEIESGFRGLSAANADNALTGKGAAWTFAWKGQLQPGSMSEPRDIRWKFDGQLPEPLPRPRALRATFTISTTGR